MIACIGKFDALHQGHFALVRAAAHLGQPELRPITGMSTALGWSPRAPLVAEADRHWALSRWEKALHVSMGERALDFTHIRRFDLAAFCAYLRADGARGVVVGADFRGGSERSENAEDLQRAAAATGLSCAVVAAVSDSDGPLSSSRIRAAVRAGEIDRVCAWCARAYRLSGVVVRGDGRGKKLGFATANIAQVEALIPALGVYAAWAELPTGRRYRAAVNIGHLPTIGTNRAVSIEAHLLDFSDDIYGQRIALDCVGRLRAEQRFASVTALIEQISRDIAAVRGLTDSWSCGL